MSGLSLAFAPFVSWTVLWVIAGVLWIGVPAYIVASYSNMIHTPGTFRGWRRIASTEKWLRIHNTMEWPDYYEQAKGLVEGGADFLLIETCFDTGSLKAGLVAVEQLRRDLGVAIPVVASVTIERTGTMLGGPGLTCTVLAGTGATWTGAATFGGCAAP